LLQLARKKYVIRFPRHGRFAIVIIFDLS